MATILIVDDSTLQRRQLQTILLQAGYAVTQASNGREALEAVRREIPSAVVTDIHMPEMDGISLVGYLRKEIPAVPVLVTTDFGNEDLAVRALRAGASSYVAKKHLSRDILQILDELLSVATIKQQEAFFLDRLTVAENEFTIENNPDLVAHVVSHVESLMLQMRIFDESEHVQIGVAVHEATVNAIVHGNLEISSELKSGDWQTYHDTVAERNKMDPYQTRRVTISVRATREPMLTIRIADQGRGYDPNKLPDPTDIENIMMGCGRGLLLIRTFFDTVTHSPSGNEITMVKRKSTRTA